MIIGAPLFSDYSTDGSYETGRVYIFYQNRQVSFEAVLVSCVIVKNQRVAVHIAALTSLLSGKPVFVIPDWLHPSRHGLPFQVTTMLQTFWTLHWPFDLRCVNRVRDGVSQTDFVFNIFVVPKSLISKLFRCTNLRCLVLPSENSSSSLGWWEDQHH